MKITDSPIDKIISHLVDQIRTDEGFLEERIAVDLEYWLDKKSPMIAAGGHLVQPTDDPLIIALALLQALRDEREGLRIAIVGLTEIVDLRHEELTDEFKAREAIIDAEATLEIIREQRGEL